MTKIQAFKEPKNKAKIDMARQVVDRLVNCRQEATKNILEVGMCLNLVYVQKLWKYLDCEHWKEFLGSIEMPYSSARDAMGLYSFFVEEHQLPIEELATLGRRKLQILLPYLKKHPNEISQVGEFEGLLHYATEWSVSDTINEVRQLEGKEPMSPRDSNQLEGELVCVNHPNRKAVKHHFPLRRRRLTKEELKYKWLPVCPECHNETEHREKDWLWENKVNIFDYFYEGKK